jgi:hypothetical protein
MRHGCVEETNSCSVRPSLCNMVNVITRCVYIPMIDHLEGCAISTAVAGCNARGIGLLCCSTSRPPLQAESKMATAVVLVRYLGPCCRQPPISKISLRRSKRKAEVPIRAWGYGLTWCRSMMVSAVHKCDLMMAWAVYTNATAAVKRGRRPQVWDEDEKF